MEIGVAIIAAFVAGAFATLISNWYNRKKTAAEIKELEANTNNQISEAWARLIAPLESSVKHLELENKTLKTTIEAMIRAHQAEIRTLQAFLDLPYGLIRTAFRTRAVLTQLFHFR